MLYYDKAKTKVSSYKSNSKNDDPVLLIKTVFFWHLNYFLSSFATDEEDELGLKLENVGPFYLQVLMICLQKSPKTIMVGVPR